VLAEPFGDEVDSDTQSAVTLVSTSRLRPMCGHAEALVDAGVRCGLRSSLACSLVQHKFDYVL